MKRRDAIKIVGLSLLIPLLCITSVNSMEKNLRIKIGTLAPEGSSWFKTFNALNAEVTGSNLAVGDCGGSCIGLIYGGVYEFTHCTLANYWPTWYSNRQLPALLLADYFPNIDEQGNLTLYVGGDFEKARFRNSIISGNSRMELVIDSYDGSRLTYRFDHCLTRIDEDSMEIGNDPFFTSIINNEDPLLVDTIPNLFLPDSLSPAINAGLPSHAIGVPFDFNGISRLDDEAPDLGAFERIEGQH